MLTHPFSLALRTPVIRLHSWLYRIKPAVCHGPFQPYTPGSGKATGSGGFLNTPNQLRWSPFPVAVSGAHDFIDGLCLVAHAGDPASRHGLGIFIYTATCGMDRRAFYNSDGDWLLVPQQGSLLVSTEFGPLQVAPNEICVIPRGIRFAIEPELDGSGSSPSFARGYILEVYDGHFELPDLGPIGANGLANPQDFLYPRAAYVDDRRPWTVLTKYLGEFYAAPQDHSPFDVVAWRGNYAPYKYDLARFNTLNTVSWDHIVCPWRERMSRGMI